MARLGKRERAQRREIFRLMRLDLQAVVSANLSSPKPKPSEFVATRSGFVARSRDETRVLMGNTHTQGIRIGSQLKPRPEGRPVSNRAESLGMLTKYIPR